MILEQFKEVLSQQWSHAFPSEGEIFDPFMHEAVETEETTKSPKGPSYKNLLKDIAAETASSVQPA